MNLVKWDTFRELEDISNNLNRFLAPYLCHTD